MSQIDRLHFLPTLIWVIILFLIWYFLILCFVMPLYYKTLRTRFFVEKHLWNKINTNEYILKIIEKFFMVWMIEIVKTFKIRLIFLKYSTFITKK